MEKKTCYAQPSPMHGSYDTARTELYLILFHLSYFFAFPVFQTCWKFSGKHLNLHVISMDASPQSPVEYLQISVTFPLYYMLNFISHLSYRYSQNLMHESIWQKAIPHSETCAFHCNCTAIFSCISAFLSSHFKLFQQNEFLSPT